MQNNKAYQLYHSLSYHSCMINSWNSIWNINCKCTAHRISLSLTPFQVICKIILWIWRFLKIQKLTFAVDTKLMSWWAYFKLYICYNFLLKYSACFSRILLLNNFSFLGLYILCHMLVVSCSKKRVVLQTQVYLYWKQFSVIFWRILLV